jgi:hypothetical protein
MRLSYSGKHVVRSGQAGDRQAAAPADSFMPALSSHFTIRNPQTEGRLAAEYRPGLDTIM